MAALLGSGGGFQGVIAGGGVGQGEGVMKNEKCILVYHLRNIASLTKYKTYIHYTYMIWCTETSRRQGYGGSF